MKIFAKIMALTLVAVFVCATLASCAIGAPNADPAKAEKSLEKKGYVVELADSEYTLGFVSLSTGLKNLDAFIKAVNPDDSDDSIMICYFKDKEAADKAWEDTFEALKEKAKEEDVDAVIKKSGKMIWVGTKDAINAAK